MLHEFLQRRLEVGLAAERGAEFGAVGDEEEQPVEAVEGGVVIGEMGSGEEHLFASNYFPHAYEVVGAEVDEAAGGGIEEIVERQEPGRLGHLADAGPFAMLAPAVPLAHGAQ